HNVDRGRKDHWALYPCPDKMPVIYEPLPGMAPNPVVPQPTVPVPVGKKPVDDVVRTVLRRRTPSPLVFPGVPQDVSGQNGKETKDRQQGLTLGIQYEWDETPRQMVPHVQQVRVPYTVTKSTGGVTQYRVVPVTLAKTVTVTPPRINYAPEFEPMGMTTITGSSAIPGWSLHYNGPNPQFGGYPPASGNGYYWTPTSPLTSLDSSTERMSEAKLRTYKEGEDPGFSRRRYAPLSQDTFIGNASGSGKIDKDIRAMSELGAKELNEQLKKRYDEAQAERVARIEVKGEET